MLEYFAAIFHWSARVAVGLDVKRCIILSFWGRGSFGFSPRWFGENLSPPFLRHETLVISNRRIYKHFFIYFSWRMFYLLTMRIITLPEIKLFAGFCDNLLIRNIELSHCLLWYWIKYLTFGNSLNLKRLQNYIERIFIVITYAANGFKNLWNVF